MTQKPTIIWDSTEAAVVTGGSNSAPWCATGIALKLEDIKPGDLFVASREDDLEQVFQKGAAAVMLAGGVGDTAHLPALRVGNAFEALQSLARAARFRTHATIVAVQGKDSRASIQAMLENVGSTHCGGRHLSLGMAGLPNDVEYGVFGLSPMVQPDIAVITHCEQARRDTLFENMSANATVIINGDEGDESLAVIARAKAAGIAHVYTYGLHAQADISVTQSVQAQNGQQVSVQILGEVHEMMMPPMFDIGGAWLAGLMVLHLTDRVVQENRLYAGVQDKGSNVQFINPLQGQERAGQAVFKITNMIDLGFGQQTAMLDNVAQSADKPITLHKKGLAIPRKLDSLNFVYTSKKFATVSNARAAISETHKGKRIESIVPDVLMPGDFVVFKNIWGQSKNFVSEALRLVPDATYRKLRIDDAV